MATTCVLGHAWNPGMVLCPTCGFGQRNLPDPQAAAAVPMQALAPAVEQVAARLPVAVGGTSYADPDLDDTGYAAGQPAAEQILSPDGQWAWDGQSWVPAVPAPPADEPTAELSSVPVDEAPARGRRRNAKAAKQPKASAAGDSHRVNPRLLLGGVVVIAGLVAADLLLGLPPLGHKTAPASVAPVVVHRATGIAARDLAAKRVLGSGAKAQEAYRAKSGLYTSSVAVLRTAGMAAVAAPAAFAAVGHHGTGYCLTAATVASSGRWFLYDSVKGGIRPTTYPTEAAALAGCSQKT